MIPTFNHRMWLAGLVVAILFTPVGDQAGAVPQREGWLEQLTGFVVVQRVLRSLTGKPRCLRCIWINSTSCEALTRTAIGSGPTQP